MGHGPVPGGDGQAGGQSGGQTAHGPWPGGEGHGGGGQSGGHPGGRHSAVDHVSHTHCCANLKAHKKASFRDSGEQQNSVQLSSSKHFPKGGVSVNVTTERKQSWSGSSLDRLAKGLSGHSQSILLGQGFKSANTRRISFLCRPWPCQTE